MIFPDTEVLPFLLYEISNELSEDILSIVNNVLKSDRDLVIDSNQQSDSSTKILELLNTLALSQEIKVKGKIFCTN